MRMGKCLGKSKVPVEEADEAYDPNRFIIWIFGGPGSGRGTQCSKLASHYKLLEINAGSLLREVATRSPSGWDLKRLVEKQKIIPKDIIMSLIKEEMAKNGETARGFIITGCPRDAQQGDEFEKKIGPCSLILYYDCSDDIMKKRLLERGGPMDTEEEIVARLVTFHSFAEALLKHYGDKVIKIDGSKDPDHIFEISKSHVDKLLPDPKLSVSSGSSGKSQNKRLSVISAASVTSATSTGSKKRRNSPPTTA